MTIHTLINNAEKIVLTSLLLLFLSLLFCGCNRVILVNEGQSVRLLQDVKNVSVSVITEDGTKKTGKAILKAGGFVVYVPAKEIINGDQ